MTGSQNVGRKCDLGWLIVPQSVPIEEGRRARSLVYESKNARRIS
jgi:hypothetical protein